MSLRILKNYVRDNVSMGYSFDSAVIQGIKEYKMFHENFESIYDFINRQLEERKIKQFNEMYSLYNRNLDKVDIESMKESKIIFYLREYYFSFN